MIEVSEEKYNEHLRYCKSVEWMGAIKKSSVNRLNDGPRRRFSRELGLNIECLVDTGAPVNIIDEANIQVLGFKTNKGVVLKYKIKSIRYQSFF
jgi:hypothetical protein